MDNIYKSLESILSSVVTELVINGAKPEKIISFVIDVMFRACETSIPELALNLISTNDQIAQSLSGMSSSDSGYHEEMDEDGYLKELEENISSILKQAENLSKNALSVINLIDKSSKFLEVQSNIPPEAVDILMKNYNLASPRYDLDLNRYDRVLRKILSTAHIIRKEDNYSVVHQEPAVELDELARRWDEET